MLPIGDHNPTRHISKPYVTYALMAACVGIFLLEMIGGFGRSNVYNFAVYPALFTNQASAPAGELLPALRLVSYQFLHGDLMHLLGNMLALWVVGDNVEDAMGHLRYLLFYLLGGVVAALAQIYFAGDPFTPMIGASGSIAALFAAYLMMHPFARFILLIFFFPVPMPAIAFFAVWFAQQVFGVFAPNASNVAWWAHLGGFACGALLIPIFKYRNVALDPLFAWMDFIHRTPTQKRWASYRRGRAKPPQRTDNNVRTLPVPHRRPLSPQEAEFKADYRAYLDSAMSKQEFETKWGDGSLLHRKPMAHKAQPWGSAPEGQATEPEPEVKPRKRRSIMPSTHHKD